MTCEGTSSAFSVAGNQTTAVNVLLACTTTSEAGTVLVNGAGLDCASWHTAIANPATAATGGTVSLVGWASGPDPGAITYQWSAPTGTLTNATKANATFTCPATPGKVTITLTVGDGTVPPGATCPAASSTTTLEVTCAAAVSLVSTCSGLCLSATEASYQGPIGYEVRTTFTITNEGIGATGALVAAQGSDVFGDCASKVLAPGASCTVYSTPDCSHASGWISGYVSTAKISDPSSGTSVNLSFSTTCFCSSFGGRCVRTSNCCPGPGGQRPCSPSWFCGFP